MIRKDSHDRSKLEAYQRSLVYKKFRLNCGSLGYELANLISKTMSEWDRDGLKKIPLISTTAVILKEHNTTVFVRYLEVTLEKSPFSPVQSAELMGELNAIEGALLSCCSAMIIERDSRLYVVTSDDPDRFDNLADHFEKLKQHSEEIETLLLDISSDMGVRA